MALGGETIDAASFTAIRLLSGAITLILILALRKQKLAPQRLNLYSAAMLFTYAIFFSFAYIQLATGTGALILFGTVQLTMISYGLYRGERPGTLAWFGFVAAFAGMVYLLLPSVSAPPLGSSLLMVIAGVAWGIYSLYGKSSQNPLLDTAWNFIAALPLVAVTSLLFLSQMEISQTGVILAILSGALASGVGYAIWYAALPHLLPTNAATVQLSVPVISAVGGILFMSEPISLRLLISGLIVLGGIYLTIRYSGKV